MISSTPLVMGLEAITAGLAGPDLLPVSIPAYILFLLHITRANWELDKGINLYTGLLPDVYLFTSNDGILFQPHLGLRFEKERIVLSVECVHYSYWGFERESRNLGWGIGLSLGLRFPEKK